MANHCANNTADRALGGFWERRFCILAAQFGYSFTPLQIDRAKSIQAFAWNDRRWSRYTLPDITVWTSPGQHHEIKHKEPTKWNTYGLEAYRFNALLWFMRETGQDVLYTIHNHALAGGRDVMENDLNHWFTARIADLNGSWKARTKGNSYVNGVKKEVPIYYWSTALWTPLKDYWKDSCSGGRTE